MRTGVVGHCQAGMLQAEGGRNEHSMQASSGTDTATASLVREARTGGRYAFQRLVDQYQGAIFRMVYYRVQCHADAEDLTQEIFIRAFRRLAGLQNVEHFRSWLYRIAVNRVRDHLRKKRFRALFVSAESSSEPGGASGGEMPVQEPDAEQHVARHEFWQLVRAILGRFSRMEREVFMLRFFDGLGIREIARVVGKSESTVKTHLYRGIRKFRDSPQARKQLEEIMK